MPAKKSLSAILLVWLAWNLSGCISIGDATDTPAAGLTPLAISQEKRDPLAALTGTPVVSDVSGSVTVHLQNNSDWNVCYAYITAPTDDTWGKDRLDNGEEIAPGATRAIPFKAGAFDLLAENCDYMALNERYGLVLAGDYTWEVNGPQELFFSDFSAGQPALQLPTPEAAASINNEMLEISAARPDGLVLAKAGLSAADVNVVIEATAAQAPTEGNASFAAACRLQPNGDGYVFLARSDSQYSIQKVSGQKWTPLVDWHKSADVALDAGVNVLEARCKGDKLRLRVNGLTVANVQDAEFTNGDFGLGTINYSTGKATYQFDNVSVVIPDAFK